MTNTDTIILKLLVLDESKKKTITLFNSILAIINQIHVNPENMLTTVGGRFAIFVRFSAYSNQAMKS